MRGITKKRGWLKLVCSVVAFGILLGFAALVAASAYIRSEVRASGKWAQQHHPGEAVGALVACLEDSTLNLKERNRAIWALGQLGDRRALPALRQHHTGQPCDHAQALCQHELDKAIRLIDDGVNLTTWLWREQASR